VKEVRREWVIVILLRYKLMRSKNARFEKAYCVLLSYTKVFKIKRPIYYLIR